MSRVLDALDLAVLKPTATRFDVLTTCELVKAYNVHAICVAPIHAQLCVEQGVRTCAVIGFPHGNSTPLQKINEAFELIALGVKELDIVINYGLALTGDLEIVEYELKGILDSVAEDITIKAILESCYYSDLHLALVTRLCAEIGVDFVKTSTGFGSAGANRTVVKIMLDSVEGTKTQVKASGGIKSYSDATWFLDLGCTRLGASQLFLKD